VDDDATVLDAVLCSRRQAQRSQRRAPDQELAGVAEQVGPDAGDEPVRQPAPGQRGDRHEKPPSACTTLPLRTAPSREQQKAIAAATSSGSRSRRNSWWAANASTSGSP